MNYKRIIAVLTVLCISFGISGVLIPSTIALDESYEMSAEYKASQYYENLMDLTLGDDQVANVLAVALSQLGYHEGDSDSDFGGSNLEGEKDFVEYNVFFGKLDKSYGYPWCASFATWCLRQAGVSEQQSAQIDPSANRSSWQWRKAFVAADQYNEKDGYDPQAGDIIFFKDVDDPFLEVSASHVGIVLFSDEATVYVIEGNTNSTFEEGSVTDCVAVKEYPIDSKYIVGYGTPQYESGGEISLVGWRLESESEWSRPADLEELYAEMRAGGHIVPVWSDDVTVTVTNVLKIALVILIISVFAAVITWVLVAVFKKKPEIKE